MMQDTESLPAISIIVEWDNAMHIEPGRIRNTLVSLREQLIELKNRFSVNPELLFVFDQMMISENDLVDIVKEGFDRDFDAASVEYVPAEGLRYYELKNLGAEKCSNDILVFLDSDVVPVSGWLHHLLMPFRDKSVRVVAGQCNFEQNSLVAKTFAMFWYFHLPDENIDITETRVLYANNFAIYRDLFESIRFPESSYFRGQCVAFSEHLRRRGETIYLAGKAAIVHPAPERPAYFFSRALCEGHDYQLKDWQHIGKGIAPKTFRKWRYGQSLKLAARSIMRKYREVGLSPAGAVAAMMIATVYITFVAAGKLITRYHPDFIPRHFAI
ncbi:MAG: glycosyltransferase [Gammaproteobacteria bacterium]|nr:glycosyltransferase [Gammaproteobacteria bacterium]